MKEVPEKKPTGRTQADTPAPAPAPGLSPHSVQRLQGAVGNAAVARLVAQRYTAPVKTPANAAPGFRRVGADVAAKKRTMAAHAPAAAESKSAQDAAVAPPDDKEAQGKAANAEKMNAAKPGEFDKVAFVAAVDKAIEAQAPKNLDEADKFSKSGKADKVKDEVDGKVTDGKNTSAKDIETTTKAPPDTSAAKDKPVTPMTPDNAPGNPGAPSAADAIPEKQPPAVTDFSQGPAENDKAMADAEVTEEQLAKGNEPEFDGALKAKKTAETDSAKAPGKAHTAEDQQLATAKAGAAAAGAQAMNTLTATRAAAGKAVDGGKGETKSKDERKRAEVTAKLQKVFDATKKDVETTLTGLDQKVDTAFTTGEKSARDAFTADHKARMKKYKDKRYGGFLGKGRWLKDKFAGMPQEANDLYQESRKLYVARMRTVISSVADMIGVELGRAKARIAQGRSDLKAEVDKLPADLKSFGEEAQQDFAGKFEDLEASVDEKSQQLVQDLANKYTAALNAVDEEIKKLQEANKGLIDKAKDAIVGVIKTINELKNLLLGILAKAASAIMKIIKDPIGFLGNLVKAVGAGLNLFVANIGDHLKKGLVSWLLGTATKAGLEIPERFDLRGIITLITSLLGLTWDNIRTRITRKGVPEEAMTAVESSVPVAQSLAKEGPAGAVKEIEAEAGDLKSTILSKLTEYLVPTVIIAGVTWILSLLNPASAFVRAVKGIIDIVTFVVNQGAQIADFVNAVLDAVIEIANGGAAGVPKMVETALAASIPLLIGFLASLLGIGNLANKVKSVFQAVSKPVNRAIDKIVDFIAKKGKALWSKIQSKAGGRDDTPEGKSRRLAKGLAAARSAAQRLNSSGRFGRSALRAAFATIRSRYRMTSLEPVVRDGSWSARGTVNPTDERPLGVTDSDVERDTPHPKHAQYLEMIRQALPRHAENFSKEAQEKWNKVLSVTEVNEEPVWDDPPVQLDGLPEEAAKLLTNENVLEKLVPYFTDKTRRKSSKGGGSGTAADTDSFYNHAFRVGGPLREKTLKALGKAALQELQKPRAGRSADATNEVNVMQYGVAAGTHGKFAPLPGSGAGANKDLEATVTAKGGVIGFLRFVATESSEWNTKVLDLWVKHKPSKEYLMDLFRRAASGNHEWIPTDYIPVVLVRAMGHLSRGDKLEAARWVALHHALRSKTEYVIWAIEGVKPNGHSGALWEEYIKDGKTKYKFTLTNGQDDFHKKLRDLFNRHQGRAQEYVGVLRERMKDANDPLIWNGNIENYDPQFLDKPVAALVKTPRGIIQMTVRDLGAEQKVNFNAIMQDLDNADDAVREVS
ncbi:phage tail protein [Streptomyces hydrogenans]|uniref:phage tail protein n=1 Tax=Streptomyces hydrogenans TaxID=1873719 RepID=UPI003693B529